MLVSGCGSGEHPASGTGGNDAQAGKSAGAALDPIGSAPLTLQVYMDMPILDEDYQKLIAAPVKKKFPTVTLEKRDKIKDNSGDINDQVASGYAPDLLLTGFYNIANMTTLGIPYEVDELVKQQNVDLSQFEKVAVDALRGFRDGKLVGLPLYMNTTMLFYNKDIFDKFGVAYPQDGMSWNAAVELARKLTRSEAGVNYQGLAPGSWDTLGSQLSVPKVDPKTNKAVVNSAGYKTVFQLLKTVYSIPGMDSKLKANDIFIKDRTLAMNSYWLTDMLNLFESAQRSGNPLNWDMVTTPHFQEKPGIGSKVDSHILMVSAQSKYKAQVFEIMKYLTSDVGMQTEFGKAGRIPILKNPQIEQHYGENYASLQGKHIQAVFKTKMAPLPPFSVLENEVKKPMGDAYKNFLSGKTDINTALRTAEEEANKNIETALTK
jgi:multiple sugar transport system substrate-binding protein